MTEHSLGSRRDFLRGRPARDSGRKLAEQAADSPRRNPGVDATLETASHVAVSRRAMACTFEVLLPIGTSDPVAAGTAALDLVSALEDQLTVYRDTSEVSRINALAASGPIPVEERLFEFLVRAVRLSLDTDGAFDVAAGALVRAWGFLRGPKRVPAPAELREVMTRVGFRLLRLDPERRTIEFRRPGVELNLGAIGKGYALDRAAELLQRDWKIRAALLHGGRSSIYALGSPPHDPRGWRIGVRHPSRPDERMVTLWIRDRGVGTSGAMNRFFEVEGRRFGHILDPRTGWPACGQAGVTVVAPTAAAADALSTALFIGGVNKAREYCARHPEVGAILVPDTPDDLPAEPVVLNLPPESVTYEPLELTP